MQVATEFVLKHERKMAKLEPSASRLKYERKLERIRSLQAPLPAAPAPAGTQFTCFTSTKFYLLY